MPLVQGPGTAGALDGANGRVKIWNGTDVLDASTPYFDADGDNSAQTIKNTPGYLASLVVSNSNTAQAWIQLFNTASPSVGTTVPVQSYPIPEADAAGNDGVFGIVFDGFGMRFSDSIKYACTTTATGSGDPTTGLVVSAGYR